MLNLKNVVRKYDIEINDLDALYYQTCKQVKKMGKLNEDLFSKYFEDRLQELYLDQKDILTLSDYYTTIFIDEQNQELVDKVINSTDEPIEIIKDEMVNKACMDAGSADVIQTSGQLSQVIGRSRPKGYKTELINLYDKQ